jgi:hypothetical protein
MATTHSGHDFGRCELRQAALQRPFRVEPLPLRQTLPDLQRRQMRSPDHSLKNGVLQTRHGLVLGSAGRSGSGFVWSCVTASSVQVAGLAGETPKWQVDRDGLRRDPQFRLPRQAFRRSV